VTVADGNGVPISILRAGDVLQIIVRGRGVVGCIYAGRSGIQVQFHIGEQGVGADVVDAWCDAGTLTSGHSFCKERKIVHWFSPH